MDLADEAPMDGQADLIYFAAAHLERAQSFGDQSGAFDFPSRRGDADERLVGDAFLFGQLCRDFDEEVVLTAVEPSGTRVKISFPEKGTALGASKSYQADFEIPPGSPETHHKDAAELLTLKFNHPQAPELRMYVDYQAK